MPESYRIAIVGAASLRGKELNDALGESAFAASEILLMDDDSALGQLEAVGDEVTFIQRIEPSSFDRLDFVLFTSGEDVTRKHWQHALTAGASILDSSYALDREPDVLVRAPWVREEMSDSSNQGMPDLQTRAIVPAHPAALVLALLMARLNKAGAIRTAWATILEPASEHGRAAMDELHQQTVTLLSFQTLPREVYDAQVAFNCVPVLGENARFSLATVEARIRRHYALLSGGRLPQIGIQLIHAPVFHGHNFSVAIEMEKAVSLEKIEATLTGDHVDVVLSDEDAPTNLSSAGQEDVLVRIQSEEGEQQTTRFWIWGSTDNLKIAALNMVACAAELRRLRPLGKVQ